MTPDVRILHVETRHRRGGAERNLLHTAMWESRHGHEVHLVVGRDSLLSEIPPDITVHMIPSLVRAISPLNDVRSYFALRRLVRDSRFDVVHTHQSKAGAVGRLAARGIAPVVVHTIHMASFGSAFGSVGSAIFKLTEQLCARWTDVIVSVGDELRQVYLAAGIGKPAQYTIIRSPIEITAFTALRSRSVDQRVSTRAKFAHGDSRKLAVVIASLEPRKRVDLILRELVPILRSGEVDLAIAGDGPERERLASLADGLQVADRVWILGHVSDVPSLLLAADVLVHAATIEGVPQVTIQALAAGVPIVATEMIGLREVEGAAIRIVGTSGADLLEAVSAVLHGIVPSVSLAALEPWTAEGVDRDLAVLHQRFRAKLGSRSNEPAA